MCGGPSLDDRPNTGGPRPIRTYVREFTRGAGTETTQNDPDRAPTQKTNNRFPAVIMHIKEPKSAALIFNSGKMVVTGMQS